MTEVALYRFVNDVLLQDGKQTLSVNWVEITVVNAKTGDNSITIPLSPITVLVAERGPGGTSRS